MEDPLQEVQIFSPKELSLNLEDSESRPGVHRWVDITKVPFVGRKRSIGLHVPFTGHQVELLLGKPRVDHCDGNAVEGGVPAIEVEHEQWSRAS